MDMALSHRSHSHFFHMASYLVTYFRQYYLIGLSIPVHTLLGACISPLLYQQILLCSSCDNVVQHLGKKLSLHISNIGQASPQTWKQTVVFMSLTFLESARNATYECERFHYLRALSILSPHHIYQVENLVSVSLAENVIGYNHQFLVLNHFSKGLP